MAMKSPSSSSSFSYTFKYQVFLSFRGSDPRYGFTGNLYNALTDNGIHTFIDNRELQRGNEIKPSLDNAIEESRIYIPVFSANYASSSFCLDELVHIIHCYKTKGRLVLPIFFGVEPTNVRHHTGSYGEALAEHEKRFQNNKENMERMQNWKTALTQAANLSGDHRSPTPGYEYKFIGKIVKYISNKISREPLHVAAYPVGLHSQVQQVKSLLDKGSDDEVHMVGIYGIGGMGKSTLARAVYNFVADQFEGLCFLHDVRDNSAKNNLKHLQEKLLLKTTGWKIELDHVSEGIPKIKERLCRKKILLILDDVDNIEQLHALAGGLDWFCGGSRVIITTRNKHLLSSHGIKITHAVEGLNETKALELLRWMAFKSDIVPSGYEEILNRAVAYASGLPLVLEIVGSNLLGKSIDEWKGTLDGYEKIPNKKIQEILKISYDGLEEEEQSVFLDIACCLKGCYWEEAKYILHSHYGHRITHHLRVLSEKSLIDQNHHYVTLHNLIEDMGKEVVRQESHKEPGERSRLWSEDDIVHVLKENTGTRKIEMIYMNFPSMESVIDQKGKAFKKMIKLKTLIIENGHFSKGLKYLPSSLIVLKCKGCLSEFLPSSILNKKFQNMKLLTLDECEYLTHIPDLSCLSNLEKFKCYHCKNLITIDDSIGHQNKLEFVDVAGCNKLKSFPRLWLVSVKQLEFCYCESLKSFRELLCKSINIKEIELNGTSIEELPFQNLNELCRLLPWECGMLRFPKHNDKMYSNVEYLYLRDANLSDECLPILITLCANVKVLNLSENNFKILPECPSECHLLRNLSVKGCKSLEEIRGIPPNLNYLDAIQCESLSSSTKRMLLSQKLHEGGCTEIRFPNRTERIGIPDWFEHQINGHTFSFWFRKKIPSINCILFPVNSAFPDVDLFINGYGYSFPYGGFLPPYFTCGSGFMSNLNSEHAFLFDLKLEEQIRSGTQFKGNLVSEMAKALLENEWIHVKLSMVPRFRDFPEDMIERLSSAQMGIHVLKEKSNTEEDVIFINPHRKYSNTSLSEFEPPLKKQRLVEMGVSETQIMQQQHLAALVSDMRNLVLTETKEKEQQLALLSGIRNMVLTETKEKEHHG